MVASCACWFVGAPLVGTSSSLRTGGAAEGEAEREGWRSLEAIVDASLFVSFVSWLLGDKTRANPLRFAHLKGCAAVQEMFGMVLMQTRCCREWMEGAATVSSSDCTQPNTQQKRSQQLTTAQRRQSIA